MNGIWLLVTFAMMAMASPQSPSAEFPLQVRVFQTNPGHYSLVPAKGVSDRFARQAEWLLIEDAIVTVGTTQLVYVPADQCYHGKVGISPQGSVLQVQRAGYLPQAHKIFPPREASLGVEIFLVREGELQLSYRDKIWPVIDPRPYQGPWKAADPRLVPEEPPISTMGCVLGKIAEPSKKQFAAFCQKHQVKVHFIDESHRFIGIAPGPGQTASWLYSTVMPKLAAQPWVSNCGPFLYATSQGYAYICPQAYLELNPGVSAEVRDSLYALPEVATVEQPTDRIGVLLNFHPEIGLEALRLVARLKESPHVRYADMAFYFITTVKVGEGK
jgi:hypothetical protein